VNEVMLVRHAEPDYEAVRCIGLDSSARNVAPLSPVGRTQSLECATKLSGIRVARIVASPMTRTLQTAALLARALSVECQVEVDLREWGSGTDGSSAAFAAAAAEYRRHRGQRPTNSQSAWEPVQRLRSRALTAVERWRATEGAVVLVTHAFVIEALTGVDGRTVSFCDVLPLGSELRE
jgi:broad specificity phosphatase PhoE